MIGDIPDFVRRLTSVLPRGWLSDDVPVANLVFSSFGAAWSAIYDLISSTVKLTRIRSSSGGFLDLISEDYFGLSFPRQAGEMDLSFISRIEKELLRPRGTRIALQQALTDLTGQAAHIIEPARPDDTGGYSVGGTAYNSAGAWGNLSLAYNLFVTAYRPRGTGIAEVAGYGTGGPSMYGNLSMVANAVSDTDIYQTAAAVLPVNAVAWLRIGNSPS